MPGLFFCPEGLTSARVCIIFNQMVNYSTDRLDRIFAALADPTRRAILRKLAKKDQRVTDLAKPFDMSLPAVSKHLRVLEEAGLITRHRDGRVHSMRLETGALAAATGWIDRQRSFWEERLDALEQHLQSPSS